MGLCLSDRSEADFQALAQAHALVHAPQVNLWRSDDVNLLLDQQTGSVTVEGGRWTVGLELVLAHVFARVGEWSSVDVAGNPTVGSATSTAEVLQEQERNALLALITKLSRTLESSSLFQEAPVSTGLSGSAGPELELDLLASEGAGKGFNLISDNELKAKKFAKARVAGMLRSVQATSNLAFAVL